MSKYITDEVRTSYDWLNYGKEILERVLRFAGKQRNQVTNPHLTANETIALADYLKHKFKEKENTINNLLRELP